MRKGIADALYGAEQGKVSVLIAPTGYGKTSAVHHNWKDLSERWGRIVHVLPLRAIVSDTAKKAVKRGVPLSQMSYQAAIEHISIESSKQCPEEEKEHSPKVRKSPYMFSRYVITTYDSFTFSLYVAPIAELTRLRAHRDIGLLSAAGGAVLLDEAHLALATDAADAAEEKKKVVTTIAHAMETISKHLGRPVILMTATLPANQLINLGDWLKNKGLEVEVHLCLGERGISFYRNSGLPVREHGLDEEYESLYEKYRSAVKTRLSKCRLRDDAIKALKEGFSRIAVFCNTVGRAVEVYRELKESADAELILLHGRIAESEKRSRLDCLEALMEKGKPVMAVATQALEAGVDLDFDSVITEAAAPGAIIQRAGRGFRSLEKRQEGERGLIIVNYSEESLKSASSVYPPEEVERAIEYLKYKLGDEGFFDWRFAKEDPCFVDLLASSGDAIKVDRQIYLKLKKFLDIYLLEEGEKINNLLKSLDEEMRGAFVRDSAIIPLATEAGVVTVSLDFLRMRGKDILELRNGKAIAVFIVEEKEEEIKEEGIDVDFQKLLEGPLSTLNWLRRRADEELGHESVFLGLKVREGIYDPEVGLA